MNGIRIANVIIPVTSIHYIEIHPTHYIIVYGLNEDLQVDIKSEDYNKVSQLIREIDNGLSSQSIRENSAS
jgi:hypothetical protein